MNNAPPRHLRREINTAKTRIASLARRAQDPSHEEICLEQALAELANLWEELRTVQDETSQ